MSHLPDDRYVTAPPRVRRVVVPHRGFGTFFGRTLLGALLPGSGLLLSGKRLSGGALLGTFVTLVAGASAYFWAKGTVRGALSVAVDPETLLIIAAIAVVLVTVWIVSVIWTAQLNWPSPPRCGTRAAAVLTVTALSLALVAPTARGVQYVFIQRDLLGSLFPTATDARGRGAAPSLGEGDDAWINYPRVNVLLLGSDAAPNRPGVRPDSIMLASVDTRTGDTLLFGLPRNLENAPFPISSPLHQLFPDGFRHGAHCAKDCLLNEVWQQGEDHRDLYPGDPKPGLTATKEVIGEITGLNPDYTVVINMAGFTSLVNAMGGVDITVKDRVPIGGKLDDSGTIIPGSINGWIEPGRQHLDGYHAMWYSRGRATTNDFDRMRRQRCMVGALVKQVNPTTMLQRYPEVAKVAKDNVFTDVPQKHLPAWADLVTRMQQGKIRSLPFSNKIVNVGYPDYAFIRATVEAAVSGAADPVATANQRTATPSQSSTSGDVRRPTTSPTSKSKGSPTAPPREGLVNVEDAC